MDKTIVKSEKKQGRKQMLWIVLGAIILIVIILGIVVASIANKNVKAMNRCIESVLAELEASYTVTPVDAGEYEQMKLFGVMKFDVDQYEVKELGNLSIMRVNMGVMQMATAVITPRNKNMPLLSADYMYILSNRKSYLEFYDVVEEKDAEYEKLLTALSTVQDEYTHLSDIETSPAWYQHLLTVTAYKSGTTDADKDLENMLTDSVAVYAEHAVQLSLLTEEEQGQKLAITQEYTDGLIEKGGISTDVFKKALGDEKTKDFFDKVFFGTNRK